MHKLTIIKPVASAISREIFHSLLLLFLLSFVVFFLNYFSPGKESFHLYMESLEESSINPTDNALHIYLLWLQAFIVGNWGTSLTNGLPVFEQITENIAHSLKLIVNALLITIPFVIINLIFGFKSYLQQLSSSLALILNILSVFPIFWLCYMVIFIASSWFDYFPVGHDPASLSYIEMLLPVVLLSIGSGILIQITQHTKSELYRTLNEEYILYAKAKGAKIYKHVFKEGIIFPLLNLMSNRVAYLFSTCIIVEQIFNYPGIGRLLWQTTLDRDIPLLLGAVMATALFIRLTQFISRVIYILLNPRASHE